MPVVIRPLRPADVDAAQASSFATFVDLDRRLGVEPPEPSEQIRHRGRLRVAHLQRTDPDGAWAAESDGRLIGVALSLRRGPMWFLSLLTVESGQQGHGVGGRLLAAALRTADDAPAGWILSSPDPRALRRYALAGFALHPGYAARGPLDRALLPAGLGVRTGDWGRDADLLQDVSAALRGASYGPDLAALEGVGLALTVAEDGSERGYCVHGRDGVAALGATTPALATRLLWAGLSGTDRPEVELDWLSADQPWAIDVAIAARLPLRLPGASSCRRGALGPLTPYLPNGAYG